jgi:hypothetical protein
VFCYFYDTSIILYGIRRIAYKLDYFWAAFGAVLTEKQSLRRGSLIASSINSSSVFTYSLGFRRGLSQSAATSFKQIALDAAQRSAIQDQ